MPDATLRAIHLHPVKSCHRVEVDRVVVSVAGLEGDREWQVVDAEGRPLTQRRHPAMATIRPALTENGGIVLSAPAQSDIDVARPGSEARTVQALLGDEVAARDAGDDAAAWLSAVLGVACRLVALAAPDVRRLPAMLDQPVSFADAGPVLVANTASLSDLVARAVEPFGVERFRPNLVVEAADPWAEDTWHSFDLGAASLTAMAPWPRCAVPQVDQERGERRREPALALRAHRWCLGAGESVSAPLRPFFQGAGLFGLGCTIGPAGTEVRVGDELVVHRRVEPLLAPPAPLGR